MKSVIVHGVLALIGLVLAYRTWTHEEKDEQLPGEVTVAECEPNKLVSIEIESQSHTVVFKPTRSGAATEYWITTKTKPKPDTKAADAKAADKKAADAKAADTKTPPATPASAAKTDDKNAKPGDKPADKAAADQKPADAVAKPEPPKQPRASDPDAPITFLANKKFGETLKSLVPLRAVRGLGEIPKAKFKDFGFDKVTTHLRVDCGDRKATLELGSRTFGGSDQYAREPQTKQAYLVSGQLVMDLQSAQFKFMQSDLHDFALPDVDEVVVKAAGKERRLLQRNRLVPQDARWVDAAAPDKRNELFGNWFQRLERLKAKGYLPEGREPGSDLQIAAEAMQPVVTIEYRLEGKPKGKLELVRVDTKQGGLYYARTETTHRWTVMYDTLAKQAEDDVAMVVGAEEQTKPAQPDASSAKIPAPGPGADKHPIHPPTPAAPAAPSAAPQLPPSHPPIAH